MISEHSLMRGSMDLLPVTMLVVPTGEDAGFDIYYDAQENHPDFDR